MINLKGQAGFRGWELVAMLGAVLMSAGNVSALNLWRIEPRHIDPQIGDAPLPLTLRGTLDEGNYTIVNYGNESVSLSIRRRGQDYTLPNGTTRNSGEFISVFPKGTFTIPAGQEQRIRIQSRLPRNAVGNCSAKAVVVGQEREEEIEVTLVSDRPRPLWWQKAWADPIFKLKLPIFQWVVIGSSLVVLGAAGKVRGRKGQ